MCSRYMYTYIVKVSNECMHLHVLCTVVGIHAFKGSYREQTPTKDGMFASIEEEVQTVERCLERLSRMCSFSCILSNRYHRKLSQH